MLNRIRRFLFRVRGTQRGILLIALAYDLYLYKNLVDAGLWAFVTLVVSAGMILGTITAGVLQRTPDRFACIIDLAGLTGMGIFLTSQCFHWRFPLWAYFVAHTLICFWFTAYFWLMSRPFEYDFQIDVEEE